MWIKEPKVEYVDQRTKVIHDQRTKGRIHRSKDQSQNTQIKGPKVEYIDQRTNGTILGSKNSGSMLG